MAETTASPTHGASRLPDVDIDSCHVEPKDEDVFSEIAPASGPFTSCPSIGASRCTGPATIRSPMRPEAGSDL